MKEATAYKTKLRKALRRQQALSSTSAGISGGTPVQGLHARGAAQGSHHLRTGPSPIAKRGAVAAAIAGYSSATGKTLDGLLAWAAAYGRLQSHTDGVHGGAGSGRRGGDRALSGAVAEPIIERLTIDDDWADEELDDNLLPQ